MSTVWAVAVDKCCRKNPPETASLISSFINCSVLLGFFYRVNRNIPPCKFAFHPLRPMQTLLSSLNRKAGYISWFSINSKTTCDNCSFSLFVSSLIDFRFHKIPHKTSVFLISSTETSHCCVISRGKTVKAGLPVTARYAGSRVVTFLLLLFPSCEEQGKLIGVKLR